MDTVVRRLVVMRHAKAEPAGPSDIERPLTPLGGDAAAEVGRWLADQDVVPDHALVSSAARTRETWEAMSRTAGWSLDPDLRTALYTASPDAALDELRHVPSEAQTVVFVGHNPTVAYLAQMLSDGQGDAEALRQMADGYPPGSVTVMDVRSAWANVGYADGRVVAFHVGRA